MAGQIDSTRLTAFERGLDPQHPQRSAVPPQVLGYGEISTVLAIEELDPDVVFKRMPMFQSTAEVTAYTALYERAIALLRDEAGLDAAAGRLVPVGESGDAYLTLYMVQERLPSGAIVSKALASLSQDEIARLFTAVFNEISRVFSFNRANAGRREFGFDAQLSNWAIRDLDAGHGRLPQQIRLAYIDTNTPLMRENGVEQLDPELMLRSTPSFMRWLVRLFFLEDVMTRYYDMRKVMIDLVANLYKEQRPDLIPLALAQANAALARTVATEPITELEVRDYYRQDALTWRVYLALRKLDRRLKRLFGRPYPYMLPDHIQR